MRGRAARGDVGVLRFWLGAALAAAIAGAPGSAPAQGTPAPTGHEGHGMPGVKAPVREPAQKGERVTIVGEVIDPACYIEAGNKSTGPGHFQCAVDCAKSGQTLAILDRANDRLYLLAGEYPGQNPNNPVMQFIHKKVDVTGTVFHRSGVYGIVIEKVAVHRDAPSSSARSAGTKADSSRAGSGKTSSGKPGSPKSGPAKAGSGTR